MSIDSKVSILLKEASPGWTLPQPFYTDPDIYAFDVSTIFTRSWLMVGFEAELPQPGSYLALTVGPNPVFLVRTRDGKILGFHNTCRHRGAQILADGTGRVPKVVCPYHKWTYDLDGRLVAATRMSTDFETEACALKRLAVRTMSGCIYIALTDEAPEFEPFAIAAAPYLQSFNLMDTKIAYQSTLTEKANWKLVMENARECYHCATSHPELKVTFPVAIKPGFDFGESEQMQRFLATMSRLSLPVTPLEGSWWSVGRYPLNPGMESISPDGKPAVKRRLTSIEDPGIGGVRWATEPNSFCHVLPDYAFMFSAIPIAPQETIVVSKWFVHRDAVEGVDYDITTLIGTWTETNLQDRALAENNQRGVNGLGYSPGKYSEDAEDFVIRFNQWYRETARRHLT